MQKDSVGILLSKLEWKRLIHNTGKGDGYFHQYAKKGEELDLNILFFTIQNVSLKDLKAESIKINGDSVVKMGRVDLPGIIYSTKKYNKKENIKKIRKLSQHPDLHIINEHHLIKKENLYELIKSYSEFNKYMAEDDTQEISPFTIYLLGQKLADGNWQTPALFCKDVNNNKYSFFECLEMVTGEQKVQDESEDEVRRIAQEILRLIQYYYPGIYEIGLEFIITKSGEFYLKSLCSVRSIINDLSDWKPVICKKIVEWPIERAKGLVMEDHKTVENKMKATPNRDLLLPEIDSKHARGLEEQKVIWVKLKTFEHDEMIIKLPNGIVSSNEQNHLKILSLGVKEETCCFKINEEAVVLRNNSFHFPIEIYLSTSVVEKMHIPADLVYQFKISSGKVVLGPSIGFLLGEKNQNYNLEYMKKYEDRFGEYERYGGLVIAFSPRSIDWNENIAYGMVYDPVAKGWRYDSAPIPSTLFRRNFHQKQERINRLIEITNNKLFNSHHFKKSDLYLLREEPEIKKHLPTTHLLKDENDLIKLIDFVKVKQKIIIKPVHLSRGRGIYILEYENNNEERFILTDFSKKIRVRHFFNEAKSLVELLIRLDVISLNYLYQTYIPLLKLEERPLDVRVVMQKYDPETWGCSGIECRVAGKNQDLTNIARGGKAMTLEEVIQESGKDFSYTKIHKKILVLCRRFCQLMDKKEGHFAEFGLDIALDEEGYPWILEANIYPSFKGFKAMDYNMYLKIRYQPLLYAVCLQEFKLLKEEGLDEVYNHNQLYI
ncbi:YheC/YheD family protein [Bacillus sp. FJAT-29790]|uniref:YheC/YheD family endospore coat-associated protein n=1 Tax=Bacillus sp. FJAT-29790 TaxID=1895002 RepID=UPI001C2311D1|nr:YheC/YheD family protein [Bacillus sp. FJAT-29790]MBU8879972.1 YheC/YheD family protein [Bacillus sp. FJAT-29790]